MILITIILSFFTLVFGELVPKRIALKKCEKISLLSVKPIYFISKISKPFIKILSLSTKLILKLTGNDDMKDEKKDETASNASCQKKDAMNEQTCDGEEVKKTKEVIKEEVLNSAPSASMNIEITSEPSWKNKTGEDFWKELRKMGYRV